LAAKKKNRKLFQVAKELKLATSTLTEELETQGYKVTKAQMTPITEDMYGKLIRKFAPESWIRMQEDAANAETQRQVAESQKAREDDLQKILESGDATPKKGSKPAPSVRQHQPDDFKRRVESDVRKKSQAPGFEKSDAVAKDKPVVDDQERQKQKPKRKAGPAPSVRGAAERVEAPDRPVSSNRPPQKSTKEQEKRGPHKGKGRNDQQRPSGPAPSVRGGVSNDDILAFSPTAKAASPQAQDKRRRKRKEDAPQQQPVAPSPQDFTPPPADGEGKSDGKKRKRKPHRKGGAEGAQPGRHPVEGEKRVATGPDAGNKTGGATKRRRKRDKKKKPDEAEVQAAIKQTMAALDGPGKKKRKRRVQQVGTIDEDRSLLEITEFVSTQELATLMDVEVAELIKECMLLGLRVTINQRLDKETIELLAGEHEYTVEFLDDVEEQDMIAEEAILEEKDDEATLVGRAPIVTVMGHVDHGKTSLLDYIRDSRVADGEAGGITQHIGAYEIEHKDSKITFLDTPGHEAFTAMRARGAQVTDLVVLVVAADDQVMPQTLEAIDHTKAAGVPMVVAINKMDKPGANAEKVRQQLADRDVLVEEWGGEIQVAEVSAKTGAGIDDLLDKIILATEILELKANPEAAARGYVIESQQEKGRGTVCTVLIQRGTLRVGDVFVAGPYLGRVRAMYDEVGVKRKEVLPGQPVLVTGFEASPHVGDQLIVFKDERQAKEISVKRQQQLREQEMRMTKSMGKSNILQFVEGAISKRELNILIKGDVDGSVEAIADSLMRLKTDEVKVKIIRRAVGPISESDVLLASSSKAMIIGFNVHPMGKAREMALLHDVPFQTYKIIYELIQDIKDMIIGLHSTKTAEEVLGNAEVRDLFKISRIGTIAGCYVTEGKILRSSKVRIIRDGSEIYSGDLETLRRFKDDAKEVASGYECGMKVANYNDVKVGDVLQAYKIVDVDRDKEIADQLN
jgi:translation initiation factor IF-2